MPQELWAGPELKLEYARLHYVQMIRALDPPPPTAHQVAQISTGAIVSTAWQRTFYAHFDAFLSAARSIPEIIQCCFGHDGHPAMRAWLKEMAVDEVSRRMEFRRQFGPAYKQFRDLALSNTRHVVEHRTGVAPVEVMVVSMWGLTHVGSPTKHIPESEIRDVPNAEMAWMVQPMPVPTPNWADFKVDDQPLFTAVRDYLEASANLVRNAREIADAVHGSSFLTPPPT